jgi:hypothetical protein
VPWIVGIDEAGYGPNLGPLVMTSVACHVPDAMAEGDLWPALRAVVRRHPEPDDGRLLVDDSKLVYSTTRGLRDLEAAVLAVLGCWRPGAVPGLCQCLDWLAPAGHADLRQECWYAGTLALPVAVESAVVADAGGRLGHACSTATVEWGVARCVVFCPTRFNALLDEWGSKGAVLAAGLTELLQLHLAGDAGREPVCFTIDKHGGRNTYAAMLQHALTAGEVVVHEEGMQRSAYSVRGLGRELRLVIQPRADRTHFCVALASMLSKYLRELLMLEFNRFWQSHVPDLKGTAGYPGDAFRFYEAIRPAAARLGIAEAALWRRK